MWKKWTQMCYFRSMYRSGKKVKIKGGTHSPRFLGPHLTYLVVRLTPLANDRGAFSWILEEYFHDSRWLTSSCVAERTRREASYYKLYHVEKYLLSDKWRFKILTFSQEWLCDGINDCGLWEDEINCKRKNLVLNFAFEAILLLKAFLLPLPGFSYS